MFERIETGLTRAAAALAVLGGLGLIAATLVTCTSILLRALGRAGEALGLALPWARPILGEEELVSFGVGFALFAALPWVMIRRGHIRVDLFQPLFGGRLNRLLDLLGDIGLAAMGYLILTRQWFQIFRPARRSEEPFLTELLSGNWAALLDRLRDGPESQVLGLKLWPTYLVAEALVAAFFLIACFCVIRSARALFA